MEYIVRALRFFARNIVTVLLLVILMLIGFRVGMDTTHAYIIVTDGMRERIAEILLPAENQADLSHYFTERFLENDEMLLSSPYAQDTIISYHYDLALEPFWCMPGRRNLTMEAVLDVSSIDGKRETGKVDENGHAVTEPLSDWQRTRVEIQCVKLDGHWLIDDVQVKELLEPRATPTKEPVVTPRPTATPVPEPEYTGNVIPQPVATPTPEPVVTGTIAVDSMLNVRSGPGSQYEKLGVLYNGDQVTILGEESGWYKILFNDKEAYVSMRYVRVN